MKKQPPSPPPHRTDHAVGHIDDFPEGTHKIVQVAGREIGIFAIHGELYALPNICPHQTGPVCAGKRLVGSFEASEGTGWRREWVKDGEVIACPWHGLEYHVPTGQCLAFPNIRLRRYPVVLEGNEVFVQLRSSAEAPRS